MHPTPQTDQPQAGSNTPGHSGQGQSLLPWLILAHIPGMYSRIYTRLLDAFGYPENILGRAVNDLTAAGISAKLASAITNCEANKPGKSTSTALDACLAWLEEDRQTIIPIGSKDYPPLLAAIPDPPPLLYIAGNPAQLQTPMLAMVGSRRPGVDGRRNARWFATELANSGLGICSGLALGIDVESHAGALESGGNTVAVLGTGIDVVYPARNKGMFERIKDAGALVSEFNPGTPPRPEHFPRRNRIISGLSLGVLVVEAGMQSGSMITARFALEQGREVFAIPGSIHNPMAKGCHHLISQGAKLVQQASDILVEINMPFDGEQDQQDLAAVPPGHEQLPITLSRVLTALGFDPVAMDILLKDTGLPVDQLSIALVELELQGLVERHAAGFLRTRPD